MTDTNDSNKYTLFPFYFSEELASFWFPVPGSPSPPPAQAKDLTLKANLKTRAGLLELQVRTPGPVLQILPRLCIRNPIPRAHILFGNGLPSSWPEGWHTLPGCGGLPLHI